MAGKFLALLLLTLASVAVKAQSILSGEKAIFQIKGIVMDTAENKPLDLATIILRYKDSAVAKTAVTGNDGRFTLTAPDNKNITLEISSIGYQMKTVKVGKETEINVTLAEDIAGLNDVVVVGYGTQKKANLTGAVASISREALENKPLPNVGEVLRGVSPNLYGPTCSRLKRLYNPNR